MARTTSVTLGQHDEDFINDLIEKGRFQSVGEAVRAALRVFEKEKQEHEASLQALRDKIEAGRNSPIVKDFNMDRLLDELNGSPDVG
ncbi:type II toxin-antitoxin system ParD family antitoxin [Endozoicomonas sp. 8E]|uniref:type II toxin-antitoxin system ParD family antitoxin n=1 Tax=Endozoicomonas sp. 8E TaxID=3035692 RepID=UPI00293940C6|nr:type II toxin-antitoxin system ParD family antitoxin [Endozoicomonas sp. 8E]WOG28931.1 type II toxin-antitoxin system ParD family antitoxin [Endozoicomonas sp. 8E]